MHFTSMETSGKRYIMLDNYKSHVPYDESFLKEEFQSFCKHYHCCDSTKGFLILNAPDPEKEEDFSLTYHSIHGVLGAVRLDEAMCGVRFARTLGVPSRFGFFSTESLSLHYLTHGPSAKTMLQLPGDLGQPLVPEDYRFGEGGVCFYPVNLPLRPHVVLLLQPKYFHHSDMLFLSKALAWDKTRFPKGADVSLMESVEGDKLEVLTYLYEENTMTRVSSDGALACALVHHNLHSMERGVRVVSEGEKKQIFFEDHLSPSKILFHSTVFCVSRGSLPGAKELQISSFQPA